MTKKHTFELLTQSEWHSHAGEVHPSGSPVHLLNINKDLNYTLRKRIAKLVCQDHNSHNPLLKACKEAVYYIPCNCGSGNVNANCQETCTQSRLIAAIAEAEKIHRD